MEGKIHQFVSFVNTQNARETSDLVNSRSVGIRDRVEMAAEKVRQCQSGWFWRREALQLSESVLKKSILDGRSPESLGIKDPCEGGSQK